MLVKRESIVPDMMAPLLPRHPRRFFFLIDICMSFYLCYRNDFHLYSACLLSSLHKLLIQYKQYILRIKLFMSKFVAPLSKCIHFVIFECMYFLSSSNSSLLFLLPAQKIKVSLLTLQLFNSFPGVVIIFVLEYMKLHFNLQMKRYFRRVYRISHICILDK